VAFARWDPFRDLLTLHERIERLSGEHAAGWAPPVDLYETPDRYEVIVEVPGLSRDQIQIHVQDGTLTIEGERWSPDVSCELYHRVERGHGRFTRSFQLRDVIDSSEISADLRDGVLTISVPKTPQPETRRIPVR
jgi:HSP20 family protein